MMVEFFSAVSNNVSMNTLILCLLFLVFFWAFVRATKNPHKKHSLDWTELITRDGVLSLSKLGQAVGIIVSSWVIVIMAQHDKISSDIFGLWLAFLLGGSSWSGYLKAKQTAPDKKSD